ncbi:MAG TPA: hypothetical protein VGF55_25925 [Gemmataceae bacterium]|jgi:hypothetical protein
MSSSLLTPHSSRAGWPSRFHLLGLALIGAAAFGLTFGYWWTRPRLRHIDALAHLPWTYRWRDPGLFPNDIVTDYFHRYHLTPGVRAVYYVLVGLAGIDLTAASRLVAAGCFVATFGLLAATVRVGGARWPAVVAGVAGGLALLALPRTDGYSPFYWLEGGVSRCPAAAVLLLAVYGLARPSSAAVNVALLLGALTYPPALVIVAAAAVIAGLARRPREAVGDLLRLTPGAAAAALVIGLWYPLGVDERFGPLVTWADVASAPEIAAHHFPHGPALVTGTLLPWLTVNAPALAALAVQACVAGFDRLWRASATLLAAGLVAAVASHVLWPRLYDVERYISWPQRVVLVTTVAAVLARLADRPAAGRLAVAAVGVYLVVAAAAGAYRFSRFPPLWEVPAAVTDFLAAAPADALVAAYPGDGDAVPYFARRSLLVHPVALYPYHRDFHREMVARFEATRDAVYATDWAAVRRLRDRYSVRYLVVDRSRFRPDRYEAMLSRHVCLIPMAEAGYMADLLARGPDQPFVLRSPPPAAVVAEDGDDVIVDLTRLP